MTLAGDVMAAPTVFATTYFGTILPIAVRRTLLIAVRADPAPRAHTVAVERVASGPVLALAIHLAISAPFTQRTPEVAQRPAVARLALADVGRDASTVATILGTDGNATIAACGFRVAFAAFLHGSLFRQFLLLENCSVDDLVLGTSRREAETPRILSHGIRFLF